MNPLRLTAVCAALLLTANAPAWALNKCVGPNGAVVYQDAPCSGKGGPVDAKPASGQGNTSGAKPTVPAAPPASPQGGTGSPTDGANPATPPVVRPFR